MNTEVRQNYYEILELTENATPQEIYQAYERAKSTYSTDNKALSGIFSSEETAQLRLLVEEAYKVLSHDDLRNVYERRVMAAETYFQSDLTAEAIQSARDDLFQKAQPPVIEKTETKTNLSIDPEFENMIAQRKDWGGEELKQVREYRQLSFDELTDITKINPWYIAALEKMDPCNLPVEVFVRGYVLQVAKALGLKEKAVAESYMRQFRKKIEN